MTAEKRTYEIITHDATYRIDIPDDWKVTYGPIAIGGSKRGSWDASGGSMALRLYESEVRQRAIFTGVTSFRDLSIPVKKLVRTVKEESKAASTRGPKGRTSTSEAKVEYDEKWEDA